MARPIRISIQTAFDGSGAQQAQAALAQLQKAAAAAGRTPASNAPQTYAQQARAAQQAAQAAQKLATETQRTATAQNQAATQAQRLATEQQRTAAATANAAAAQTRAEQAALRLAAAQQRAAASGQQATSSMQALPRTLDGLTGSAAKFAGAMSGLFAVDQIVQFGRAAIDSANGLETVQASLRAVAGDAATYQKAMAAAAENQRLFGGSMQQNVEDISSFIVSSRLAGVELEQLLDISKRLSMLDPGQGAGGAAIALRELLSGNTRSLAARFELPASAIKAMGDESLSSTQKLEALSEYLNSVGLSTESLNARTETTAQSWRDLSNAMSNAKDAIGGFLAAALEPMAQFGATLAKAVADGMTVMATYDERLQETGNNILASSTSYDEYRAKVDELNAALPPLVDKLQPLSEGAYNAAKGMQETAGGIEAFQGAMGNAQSTLDEYNQALGMASKQGPEARAALEELAPAIMEQAAASEEGRAKIDELLWSFSNGFITIDELRTGVEDVAAAQSYQAAEAIRLASAQDESTAAAQASDDANLSLADALMAQADATDDSTMAGQAQKSALEAAARAAFESENAGGTLEEQLNAVASALYASGAAGLAAAGNLAAGIPGIDATTAAYIRLRSAMLAAGGGGALKDLGSRVGGPKGTGKGTSAAPTTGKGVATDLVAGGQGNFAPPKPPRGGGGGSGGGSGGRGRKSDAQREAERSAKEAQKGQERLADIAADGGQRIAEINERTAERLVEIDRKAAEERERIARELANSMALDTAGSAAEAEANDLDLVGETDKKRLKQLQAREKAEKEAGERLAAAQEEARRKIAEGDAAGAEAGYEAQKDYIDRRQKLDQEYYEKQAELGGNKKAQAELDQQYKEAVDALDKQAKLEQEIAQAKADEQAQAVADEKAAVIAAAEEQKLEVVKKAQEQAAGVKGASEDQRKAVVDDLAKQAQAATDWASATESAAGRAAEAYRKAAEAAAKVPAPGSGGEAGSDPGTGGGAGGGSAAAGGGAFVTSGPTTLTVGDNPGGVELVHVTPLSGKGSTRVGPGMARMAGGGSLLAGVDLSVLGDADALLQEAARLAAAGGGAADAISSYADGLRALLDAMDSLRGLAAASTTPLAPIDPTVIRQAAQQASQVAALIAGQLEPLTEEQAEGISRTLDAVGVAVDLLVSQRDVAGQLTGYRVPLDAAFAQTLADEAKKVAAIFLAQIVPMAEQQAEQASRFADLSGAAVGALASVAELRGSLTGYRPPLNLTDARTIAAEATQVAKVFQAILLPATQQQVDDVGRFGSLVGAAIGGLTGVLDLRAQLKGADLSTPLNQRTVTVLAEEAQRTAGTFRAFLLPATEQEAADVSRYASLVSSAVDGLGAVLDLRRNLADEAGLGTSPSQGMLKQLAEEAQRIAGTFRALLLPATEQEAADIGRYAGMVRASVDGLNATMELRRGLAEPAPAIREADVEWLATEARAVTQIFRRFLVPLTEEQAEEIDRYAGAVGASVGAMTDVLSLTGDLFADYRSPSDAQIQQVAQDARRIADAFRAAAAVMGAEGAEEAQKLADATTAAVTAARESLLTMQAINDQTFQLDTTKLGQFADSSRRLYDTIEVLGRRAAAIPAAEVAAVERVAGAIRAQAEALVGLSAVPFDNLSGLAGSFAGGSGGGSVTNVNLAAGAIVVNAAPGMDAQAVAGAVIQQLNSRIGGRR